MKRLGVFVDVQNIYYTTRHTYARQFDYRRLWQRLSADADMVVANAYATDRGDDGQRKFQDALRHIGFTVKLKPFITRRDGSAKGDWDVGITIDLLVASAELDEVVLLSGDGDFDLLIDWVQSKRGIPVTVYGVPALTADSVKTVASCFHPIDQALLL